jgi:hypothetical protein
MLLGVDMEMLRQGPRVAVPSTVTNGKWWVFSETKSEMYAIGIIYNMAGDFVANKVDRVNGRLHSYFLGDTRSLNDALSLYREV